MSQIAPRARFGAPLFAPVVSVVASVAIVASVVLASACSGPAAPPAEKAAATTAARPAVPASSAPAAVPGAAQAASQPTTNAAPQPPAKDAPPLVGFKPCSLLTAEEVAKAIGAPTAAPKETDTPYGKDGKGQDHEGVLSSCSWAAGPKVLLLAVSQDATTKEGKERGVAARQKSEAELEKRGMKVEKKVFGKIECTVLTPPPDVKAPLGVSCRGEKGTLVWFASISSKKESGAVPAETLKGLGEKVTSRLP